MKVKFLLCMVLAISMFSCSKDDEPGGDWNENSSSVVINADGTTSTGAVFSSLDETTFFLDYVKYKVVDSHLEIVGYDPIEIPADVRPYATVTLKGVVYNTRVIENQAFQSCKRMRSIVIPNTVQSIGSKAFCYCDALVDVIIPNSVTFIGQYAFVYCKSLTKIDIPNSLTYIGEYPFAYCESLTKIDIPDSVDKICLNWVYCGCTGLTNVSIPNSVSEIVNGMFSNCKSLTKVDIPNSVTIIGELAFSRCESLTNINLPDSLVEISRSAFKGCASLREIVIPPSVQKVYMSAFYDCSSLTDLYLTGAQIIFDSNYYGSMFYNEESISTEVTLHVSNEYFFRMCSLFPYNNIIADYPSNITIGK